jgi:hypothetical protein
MKALTVLSPQRDPYRLDAPAGHRDGTWFAEMVQRLVGDSGTVANQLRELIPDVTLRYMNF